MTPQIIAHRGASYLAPENTLTAFKKAMEIGADGVEMDVQQTSCFAGVPYFCSIPPKEKVRCSKQRTFWWGAQWDSNPRSPDPQSGALTDYAMGTT